MGIRRGGGGGIGFGRLVMVVVRLGLLHLLGRLHLLSGLGIIAALNR
jgi:hypothetical protein